ncbi:transketolase [Sporomusa sp.]|uniref:transketolase n=1 Tax=Sporomusa sp. TaxID=2078658 RepID=UPI002CF0F9E9|nr:transketolase [Sporomusa sp.]HWR45909.1 transketolase [Sporomusa sp.]
MDIKELKEINRLVRGDIMKMLDQSKSGHPGGSLSCVEILSTLYFAQMKTDPQDADCADSDKCILGKGHAAPALYAVLARRGFFPVSELTTLRKLGSRLQGHPDMRKVPGVDASTGSLGQGTSIAVGIALGQKLKKDNRKVYAVVGDGEMQEGQYWEAMMSAAHYKLDNLTVIIDNNSLQIDGCNNDVMSLGDIKKKMEAFGFYVLEVDGHSEEALLDAYAKVTIQQPKCIIARTVKGKGVSFMENQVGWHGKAPNNEEVNKALCELGCKA